MGRIRIMVPQLLAEHEMHAKDLEEPLGISKPTALKLAKGKMPWLRPEQLAALCELFDIGIEELLVYRPNGDGHR